MNGTEIGHLAETAPIWWPGSPESAAPITDGRHDVDVLVIGAGLAGLAAAYFVTELRPELSVAVLEAKHVGAGATGRHRDRFTRLEHADGRVPAEVRR